MEKQNTDLVVYGANGEIVSTTFQRLDLNVPTTILSYCDDVKNQISTILDSTAQMSIDSDSIVLDEGLIESISSFDESLDESDKQRTKKELPIIRSIKGLLAKAGVDKYQAEERLKTYKGRYEEYCKGIQMVVEAVEQQKQASLNDIALRNAIVEQMVPLIEELEVMVEVGHKDKATYDAETESLKQGPQDIDTQHMIQYREQLSGVLNKKLHELEKALVLYKDQIQTYRLQQQTDMQLTMEADSYIRDQAPILKAQGSVMVFNRQQGERIAVLEALNAKSNEAIKKNALELEQNIEATVALSLNQGVTLETLQVVDNSLRRGVELFRNGRVQKQQQIEQQRTSLQALNESLDEYQREVVQMIEEESAVLQVFSNSTPIKPGRISSTPYTKRLTPPTGRK
jgi:uncharacterized protein YaaN involved in tellurite resistance